MKYFDHDTDAWRDTALGSLCFDEGLEAYGLYFVILEEIYATEGPVDLSENRPLTRSVARWFGVGSERVAELANMMCERGLLYRATDDEGGALIVSSRRADENIEHYQRRAETARQNGKSGGRKPKRNRRGTKREPNGNPAGTDLQPNGGNKEKEKVLDTYTGIQIPGDSVAAADEAAPQSHETVVFPCPYCKSDATAEWSEPLGKYSARCSDPLCGADFAIGADALARLVP